MQIMAAKITLLFLSIQNPRSISALIYKIEIVHFKIENG
jgi:hypothetical protein